MLAVMAASQPKSADQLLLRWSDYPELPVREEAVEVIGLDACQFVIRSNLRVNEKTPVYLIGNTYTGNGIVRSCRPEGIRFVLTVEATADAPLPERDPGLFAIDDFLTEEEEAKILESLLHKPY